MFRVNFKCDVSSAIQACRKPLNKESLSYHFRQTYPAVRGLRPQLNPCLRSCSNSFAVVDRKRASRLFSTSLRSASEKDDGAPEIPLAIVFTDIVKSTAIWESNTEVMAKAMAVHDELIRHLTTEHTGYEVKQNGDGFMIVFQTAIAALKFCIEVQTQLQDEKWPEELLDIAAAQPIVEDQNDSSDQQSHVLWKGLRLRMAIHFGSPVRVWNGVISRWDFLGPPVNRAARYVSVCEGGQIVVSEELLDELTPNVLKVTDGEGPLFNGNIILDPTEIERAVETPLEMAVLGERHFKGVDEKQKLYIVLPKSLSGRAKFYPKHKYIQPSKGNLVPG